MNKQEWNKNQLKNYIRGLSDDGCPFDPEELESLWLRFVGPSPNAEHADGFEQWAELCAWAAVPNIESLIAESEGRE